MNFYNVKTAFLKEAFEDSQLPMVSGIEEVLPAVGNLRKLYNSRRSLAGAKAGSGHDCFLKGMIVQFVLEYTQFWTPQSQRYHWFEIVSSTSKMHKLQKNPLKFNRHVDFRSKTVVKDYVEQYNNLITTKKEAPIDSQYVSVAVYLHDNPLKKIFTVITDIENMSNIDVLAISHDHYDHLDYQTIKQIDEKVKEYCVPLGVEKHLLRWGVNEKKIHVMNWWDEVKVDGLTITSTPGRHFTGRVPWRNNTTLWSGYVFKNDKYTTYFTGDTGYGNHFEEVYEKFGAIDLLMIEDGQYDRAWSNIHMLPKDGIQAMKDLHAKWTVPVHWGAFCICNHAWDDPIKQITTRSQKENLNVATPKIGEIVDYSHIETYQEHWWENVE